MQSAFRCTGVFLFTLFWIVAGCEEPGNNISQLQSALSPYDVDNTKSEAITAIGEWAEDMWELLPTNVQTCLDGEDINPENYTVTCNNSPELMLYGSGKKIYGENVAAGCFWRCKIQFTGTGYFYEELLYPQKYLHATEVSGGC